MRATINAAIINSAATPDFHPDCRALLILIVALHKVVRWRCADLRAVAEARFGVALSERSIGRILGQRRFVRLSVRPQHPEADEAAQEAFKKTSPQP